MNFTVDTSVGTTIPTDKYQLRKSKALYTCYHELHTRPFPKIKGPVKISSLAFHHKKSALTEHSIQHEIAHITTLCHDYQHKGPDKNCRHFYLDFKDFELRWERHNEFSSYTFLVRTNNHKFFSEPAIDIVPKKWLKAIVGTVISALHIEVQDANGAHKNTAQIKPFFEHHRLLGSTLRQGNTSMWSAMHLHQDNFNRILLLSNKIHQCQSGRIIRTLLELEAYRNLILLAFPLAQHIGNEVNHIEIQLAELLNHSNDKACTEQQQLATLSTMAATLSQLIAKSRYRFDAAIAYYQIVESRFDELQEEKIEGLQTVTAFIKRRLSPALRTIKATKYRLDDLAKRTDRASDFLRTKIDMVIEQQNQELLTSMNNRAQMQLNLQQTVEGLSVIVVTYYLLALTQFLLSAAKNWGIIIDVSQTIAQLMPLYLILVWLFSLRVKKKLKPS